MSTKMKKNLWIVSATIVIIASLLVTGWGRMKEATTLTVPEGTQAGDLVNLEPCTYESKDTEYAAECGTLVVPENRRNPESRVIALPVT